MVELDKHGELSWAFNTEGMYRAMKTEGSELRSEIFAAKE